MKIYRFIPIIGIVISTIKNDSIINNSYYQLYHIITSTIIMLNILFITIN